MEVMVNLDHDPGSRSKPTRLIYPREMPRDEEGSQHGGRNGLSASYHRDGLE